MQPWLKWFWNFYNLVTGQKIDQMLALCWGQQCFLTETLDFRVLNPPKIINQPRWKFCMKNGVGELLTWCAENDWNELTGSGPTYKWIITFKDVFYCISLDLNLFFLVSVYRPDRFAPRWLKRHGKMKVSGFLESRWYENTLMVWTPKTPFAHRRPQWEGAYTLS